MLIGPDDLIRIYRQGCFPMAETVDDAGFDIIEPVQRGLLPVRDLHIPVRLARTVRQGRFEIRTDTAFSEVIRLCAATRAQTWINAGIAGLFMRLHDQGLAHSVECWREGRLVGGLYGLAIGGVFCGESMFSLVRDASKVALVHLCARLHAGGFSVLDAQFHTPHLEQFGLYEVEQAAYVSLLNRHGDDPADFSCGGESEAALLDQYFRERRGV